MSRIAFVGAGRMAGAMVRGLLNQGVRPASDLTCTCGDDPSGPELAAATGIQFADTPAALLDGAEALVLACKPQQFAALDATYTTDSAGLLVLSILAGMPLARLRERFPQARAVVRAMPNTPGQVGAGITAYASDAPLHADDEALTRVILSALGTVLPVPEGQLDAVTAISGSGPAYVFEFTAALRAAAIALGLPAETAHQLALATVTGSAQLLDRSGEDPEALRNAVTSKGGTTAAALDAFADGGLRALVARATRAAADRAAELARA